MKQPTANWLDGDEMRAWRAVASVMVRLPGALDAQLRADAGLSHFEYMVMAALSERPDRTLPMSAVAGYAEGSLSRVSHVVSRLERQGWVQRGTAADDRRVSLATLTDEGYAKVVASAPGHVAAVRRCVFDVLTARQVAQLIPIGEAIAAAIQRQREAEPGDEPPPPRSRRAGSAETG